MPELPEVETVRRQLAPKILHRRVLEADSHPSHKFTPAIELVGASINDARRRGKFLLFGTNDARELIVHLGMTGSLTTVRPHDFTPDGRHLRAWWALGSAESSSLVGLGAGPSDDSVDMILRFDDTRRFGRIRVVPTGQYDGLPTLAQLGPEPFDNTLDAKGFAGRLARSKRPIKTNLLSQRPIAGVGNIYADEALWLSKINPRATRLSVERAGRLLEAIRDVLAQSLDNGGTTLRDYRDGNGDQGTNQRALQAYGREGLPCHQCATSMRSAKIDTRTTTWCPKCQRR